jgi:hypothetical protein
VSLLDNFSFTDATVPPDSVPTVEGDTVEFPCSVCGKEAGPYGGRGPKPSKCPDHKASKSKSGGVRVTGNASNLAAQAAKTLANLNSLFAMGLTMASMFRTAGVVAEYNAEMFEKQAYEALLLDPELCRQIVRTGGKSAGMALGMAYVGMGIAVGPVAVNEYRDQRAERRMRMEETYEAGA